MNKLLFQARELKPYAEPVRMDSLKNGEIYFSLQYADDALLIPVMETWVYAGEKLGPDDVEGHLYFQDVESYLQRVCYQTRTDENSTFQVAKKGNTNHIFEFEKAVEELMKCDLRRRK
jgi:hypothetical protein